MTLSAQMDRLLRGSVINRTPSGDWCAWCADPSSEYCPEDQDDADLNLCAACAEDYTSE